LTGADLAGHLPIQFVSTGLPFLYVPLVSIEAVDRASLSAGGFGDAGVDATGAFLFHSAPASNRAYSRMIATVGGAVWEDPATGSASGPLGAYLVRYGLGGGDGAAEIISEQGTQMGRQSFVHIRVAIDDGRPGAIDVGGAVVAALEGRLVMPG
jgi:trans-2,3-dihydro-3-hydroxyanthranilate isomerase